MRAAGKNVQEDALPDLLEEAAQRKAGIVEMRGNHNERPHAEAGDPLARQRNVPSRFRHVLAPSLCWQSTWIGPRRRDLVPLSRNLAASVNHNAFAEEVRSSNSG